MGHRKISAFASRLTQKGNILLVVMRSFANDAKVKEKLLDAINSVEFKE